MSDTRTVGTGGALEFVPKDPSDSTRFSFDFTPALAIGDAVTAATVIEATGVLTIGPPSLAGDVVTARIGGGVAGRVYSIGWTASTAAGDTLTRSTALLVEFR